MSQLPTLHSQTAFPLPVSEPQRCGGSSIVAGGCDRPVRRRPVEDGLLQTLPYREPLQRRILSPDKADKLAELEARREVALKSGDQQELYMIDQQIARLKRDGECCRGGGFQGIQDKVFQMIQDLLSFLRDLKSSPRHLFSQFDYLVENNKPRHGGRIELFDKSGDPVRVRSGDHRKQVMPK